MAIINKEDNTQVKELKNRINELANECFNLEQKVREYFYAIEDNDNSRITFWKKELREAVL